MRGFFLTTHASALVRPILVRHRGRHRLQNAGSQFRLGDMTTKAAKSQQLDQPVKMTLATQLFSKRSNQQLHGQNELH